MPAGNRPDAAFAQMHQTKSRHVRKLKRARAQPFAIACTRGTEFRDVAQRVGTFIAIGGRIRSAADAKRIQNEKKRSRHAPPSERFTVHAVGPQLLKPYNGKARLANLHPALLSNRRT